MDAATDSIVEIGGTMNVSQDAWDAIFKPKEVEEIKEDGANNE